MELGTRWRDVVIDAVEQSVVHRHGHKSSAGVSQHKNKYTNFNNLVHYYSPAGSLY